MERPTPPEPDLERAQAPPDIGRPLVVHSFGLTDVGRVRGNNEDHFAIADLSHALRIVQSSFPQPSTRFGDTSAHMFMVADGIGGHRAGEQASALALETVEGFILRTLQWVPRPHGEELLAELNEALKAADARVFSEAARSSELVGMGTTLTLAYAVGSLLYVVHVGDSRCYLLRDGRLHQLTRDHTLVQEMVRSGMLEPEQAAHHHLRNIITNAVGGADLGVEVERHQLALEPEDIMLLCSDGLTEMLSDGEIAAVLRAAPSPEAACRMLIAAANAAGGRDNITAVVVRFDAVA
jgi:protein phosphatase